MHYLVFSRREVSVCEEVTKGHEVRSNSLIQCQRNGVEAGTNATEMGNAPKLTVTVTVARYGRNS